MLGYDPATLIGQSVVEYTHPDDQARAAMAIHSRYSHRARSDERMELRVRHAAGHYLWVESISQFVFDEQRQISGAVLINRDITHRKRAEEALTQYARGLTALYEISLEINSQPDVAHC